MKRKRTLLIFKDGVADFGEVSSLRLGEARHGFCRVVFRNGQEELRRLNVLGNCELQGKDKPRDLLASVRDIAAEVSDGEHGDFPLCIGLFGDSNGNVEFHIVNPAHFAPKFCFFGTAAIGKRVNASSEWRKFFIRLVNSFRNRFKAFRNKFFKFHNSNNKTEIISRK